LFLQVALKKYFFEYVVGFEINKASCKLTGHG
jgi:hypothetical protein